MRLTSAMVCSAALHIGFMVLRPPAVLVPSHGPLRKIELIFVPKPASEALRPAGSKPGAAPAPSEPVRPPPTPRRLQPAHHLAGARHRVLLIRRTLALQAPAEPPLPSAGSPAPPAPAAVGPAPQGPAVSDSHSPSVTVATGRPTSTPTPAAGAGALPEEEFAVIQHKRWVRQHLKARLVYPSGWSQGSVHLGLTLRPDGTLQDAAVSEASDPFLAYTTLDAARLAVPYPPFPRQIQEPRAHYDFLVQYRPNQDGED